jgi:UDP-N-acetylmuramate dehydrogenase
VIPQEHVSLAERCTLGVGGPARYFVEVADEAGVREAFEWAQRRSVSLRILGGGSNVVVPDEGVDALVVKIALRGIDTRERDGALELTAAAGEPWDDLVGLTVEHGWAGLECLSGIPGLVGATPIQNVGAYGQEVSDTVMSVRVLDTATGRRIALANAECRFAYRDSRFKSEEPGRYVVLGVTYRLTPGGRPTVSYADIARNLAGRGIVAPSLADVRQTVLSVRRSKSMVLDPGDSNRRSCGSFFMNPIITTAQLAEVERRAQDSTMPRWPQPDGRVKLSAAWLIEHAGFTRGHREGAVGLSTRHSLAVVAHDGAGAGDVLGFAARLRNAVRDRLGVTLVPEPVVWAPGGLAAAAPR